MFWVHQNKYLFLKWIRNKNNFSSKPKILFNTYHYGRFRLYNNQGADTGVSASSDKIQFFFGEIDGNTGFNTANVGYVFNPFQTGYTFATSESVMSSSSHTCKGHLVGGMLRQTVSVTGYTLHNPNRNYDEGMILTYGIAN